MKSEIIKTYTGDTKETLQESQMKTSQVSLMSILV